MDYFSWLTNYLDNDISDTTFDHDENLDKITMNVFYSDSVNELTIEITQNKIIFKSDNDDLQNIANQIKCKTKVTFNIYLHEND